MEAQAVPHRRPFPWRRALLALAVLLGLGVVGTAIGMTVWLQHYESLAWQGGAYGADTKAGVMVEPAAGSGGDVFFPRYRDGRTFHVLETITNVGRFPVRVLRLDTAEPQDRYPFRPLRAGASSGGQYAGPFQPLPVTIPAGQFRTFTVILGFNGKCIGGQPTRLSSLSAFRVPVGGQQALAFRIRYAHVFERTQRVPLPFAMTLSCRSRATPDAG